jgi:hypothetical protein
MSKSMQQRKIERQVTACWFRWDYPCSFVSPFHSLEEMIAAFFMP